jgi:hypothetical protein
VGDDCKAEPVFRLWSTPLNPAPWGVLSGQIEFQPDESGPPFVKRFVPDFALRHEQGKTGVPNNMYTYRSSFRIAV